MNSNRKGFVVTRVAVMMFIGLTVIGLTACAAPSPEQQELDIVELEARGFNNPTYDLTSAYDGLARYSVDVGNCRVQIKKTTNGWEYADDFVDVSAVWFEYNAEALNLQHCYSTTSPTDPPIEGYGL